MRHVFIINPYAGKKNQTARIYAMADALRQRHGLECACLLTDRPGGAEALARKAAEGGDEVRLYACGGDGTIHEVANGIAGLPNAAMTAIPAGTGNDFLKNFGPDADRFADAENLWDGEVFPLDLIDCNGQYCLTIACSGIDARIAEDVHQYSHGLLSGRGSYLASVAANFLFKGIARHWTVTLDGQTQTGDFALVSTCNGRYYGGGSMPVPEARMDDGVLNTVLVRKTSRLTFARMFGPYSDGRYAQLPPDLIQVVTAREVRIHSDGAPITTCLDGEAIHAQDVVIRLADRKLRFFGPDGCSPNATARPRTDGGNS